MRTGRRGIALMMTLMVMIFVMLLLGAFITINQSQFSLLASNQTNEALERASQSIYEYCFSRLEDNKNWGSAKFSTTQQDLGVQSVLTVTEVEGTTRIVGETNLDDVTFEVTVGNNITGSATNTAGVPGGSCRLDITVKRRGAVANHVIQLNTAPLYDASAVASQGLNINANRLTVASKDPNRNVIRSKSGIQAPDSDRLDFRPAPNSAEQGILWAAQDIVLGGSNLRTNADARNEAIADTRGRFIDNARTDYEIHDLQRDEIKIAKQTVTMGSGIYVFGQSDIQYTNDAGDPKSATVRTLERRAYNLVDGQATIGDVQEIWYYGSSIPDNYWSENEWVTTDGYSDSAVAHRVNDENFQLYTGSNLIRADLNSSKLQISANVDVQVQGDFGIYSDMDSVTPSLEFVDYDGESERGSISANGEILIEGFVSGSGKLLANGSVSLYPNSVDIQSDTNSDLAIYSGKNVRIAPPSNWSGQGDLSFTGLVYAKDNVLIQHPRKVSVEGSIVARNGVLAVDAEEVSLTYNPAYLDSIVKEMPDFQIQLERAVWIP